MTNPNLRHHDWKFYPDDATFILTGLGKYHACLLELRSGSMARK